jgi:hypothetical protein
MILTAMEKVRLNNAAVPVRLGVIVLFVLNLAVRPQTLHL